MIAPVFVRGNETIDRLTKEHLSMMNPAYHIARMRDLIDEYQPSRERSLAITKLDECEMWLGRCEPTDEARDRDQADR